MSALTRHPGQWQPHSARSPIGRSGVVGGGSAILARGPPHPILLWYQRSTNGAGGVISVAVEGYGIVIWRGEGEWRTYTASDSMSAMLATRVQIALNEHVTVPGPDDATVTAALLSIAGAHLFAVDCDHAPGECPGEGDAH